MFFQEDVLERIVEMTNLYSVQKTGNSVKTTADKITTYIGMHILMGIVPFPSYRHYWSKDLRYAQVADAMSLNRFEKLRRFLHFVDNNDQEGSDDKLFKLRPIITAIRNECIKVEPEEFQSVDEQIIPCKTKRSKLRQYNPKKPKKWGFKNMVCAGNSGMMYDFYIYCGKENNEPGFENLQKCSSAVAKLSQHLHGKPGHKLYFDNWFSTLEHFHYLKSNGINAVV